MERAAESDRGSPHERTELGWHRTGLAAAAVMGVFVRSHIERLDGAAVLVIVLSAAAVLAVLAVSYRRPSTTDGRASAAVATMVTLIAAAQLATIVLG
jgi:hypothetical protein